MIYVIFDVKISYFSSHFEKIIWYNIYTQNLEFEASLNEKLFQVILKKSCVKTYVQKTSQFEY